MMQEVQLIEIICRHCVLQSHTVVLAVRFVVVLFAFCSRFEFLCSRVVLSWSETKRGPLEHPLMNQNLHEHVFGMPWSRLQTQSVVLFSKLHSAALQMNVRESTVPGGELAFSAAPHFKVTCCLALRAAVWSTEKVSTMACNPQFTKI